MANIAVTTYCNLRCPYCFADEMIKEDEQANQRNITMEELRSILMWISKTPKNHIGIIGGEPTIHPHFDEIIKEVNIYCRDSHTTATLFTNGINLDPFVGEIGDGIGILINCNPPEEMTADQLKKFNQTMEHLHLLGWFQRKANCGCNLHIGRTDYSYIWELVDRFHLEHLRVSVTAPGGKYLAWRSNKEEYYTRMKPIFVQFMKDAKAHNVHLGPDCNHIPECYFTRGELDLCREVLDSRPHGVCEPVVDITPDFRATACFGSYDPVDCSQFEDLIQLERYLLLKKSYPRMQANATGKCANCPDHDLLICQGGCLGFADVPKPAQLHPVQPKVELDTYGHPIQETKQLDTYGHPVPADKIAEQSASSCGDCGTCGQCFAEVKGAEVQPGSTSDAPSSIPSHHCENGVCTFEEGGGC